MLVALLLAAAGAASLAAGRFERRFAIAQEDMAVLDFSDPQQEFAALEQDLGKLPWTAGTTLNEIKRHEAELQYWQGDYSQLVELSRVSSKSDEPVDPELQILAANSLYRVAQHGPQDKVTVLKNLDAAIRAYSEALRAGNDRPDTAFNYELAVRLREEIGSGAVGGAAG